MQPSVSAYTLHKASVHGTKHAKLGLNNQDACMVMEFLIGPTSYRLGVVSDGCSGIPAVSRTEVGSNLLAAFCLTQVQELLSGGHRIDDIPAALYPALTGFCRTLSRLVVPEGTYLPHRPSRLKGQEYRNDLTPAERFRIDYLAATIIGFLDDGTTLITFRKGDGVIIVNEHIQVIDQDNTPEYLGVSVNRPGEEFNVDTYDSAAVQRLVIATDGIEPLLALEGVGDQLFTPGGSYGMQGNLNVLRREYPEKLADDCSFVVRERHECEEAAHETEPS